MPLPDLSRLEQASPTLLRAIGAKLVGLGISIPAVAPLLEATGRVMPPYRKPIRRFHLRKMADPKGWAMRMFMFGDAVLESDASLTLGELLGPLLDLGLLVKAEDGGVKSPFVLGVLDDLLVFSDDLSRGGSDVVMGFGETTIELCRAAFPSRRIGRALDMGSGSGTAALLVSRRASSVVGVDINPRAIALARINARINGITNVEFRQGSLFEPVKGETFDLVVSQPPFVPHPEELGEASFLYGGPFGDEISLALLGGIPSALAPGGRAAIFVEWPDHGPDALEVRLRKALGSDEPDLLLLKGPSTSLDAHAATYSAGIHPDLGPEFEWEAEVRRAHFDRVGIRSIEPTLTIIQRSPTVQGFTEVVPILPLAQAAPTSSRIDKMLAARALAASPGKLLEAKLRVPEGTVLSQQQVGPGAEVPSTLSARFPPTAMVPPSEMTLEMLALVTAVHECDTVAAALARFADEMDVPQSEAVSRWLSTVAGALRYGFFEPA